MKNQFIMFLTQLMEANPELTKELLNDDIQSYIDALSEVEEEKPELTDNGKAILSYLQSTDRTALKAKDIADGMEISSRSVSGSIRKLVTDGFVEKMGKDPAVYSLTEKGKNYIID